MILLDLGAMAFPPSISEMASYVATPVARQMFRLIRSERGSSEEFNAATYLAEVLLKYETICSLATLAVSDASEASSIGHELVKRESLGQWKDSLQKTVTSMTSSAAAETLSYTRAFTQGFDKKLKDELADSAAAVWNEIGQSDFRLAKTRLGLIEFLVALRNRTRGHGAPLQRQYETINGPIVRILEVLTMSSPFLQKPLIAPIKLKKTDQYACRVLIGIAPQEHMSTNAANVPDSRALYLDTGNGLLQLPDLLRYHRDDDGCLFLNSSRRKSGDYDFLDYYNNRKQTDSLTSFALPPVLKPRSSTAGIDTLSAETFPVHNLPRIDFLQYVDRGQLESELLKLILGNTTNVISLGGEGGIGKTTLALRVARKLITDSIEMDSAAFDYVLWFSARDVDLIEAGPARRERQVTSLASCASFFQNLMEDFEPNVQGHSSLDYFALMLSAGSPRFLLLFDNFESFDDITALQEFLRDSLAFPSKVLITSRERNFEGDRQIRVSGLSLEQSRDLISRTARQVGCEPAVLDEKRVVAIHSKTNGNPYAIKLVVNELANGTSLGTVFSEALNERYLTTLFRRSFERVDESAQYLFLLLCLSDSARDERRAKLCCVGRSYDYDSNKETLLRHSLLDPPTRQDGRVSLFRMSWAAQEFAHASLMSAVSRRQVEEDVAFLEALRVNGKLNASSTELVAFLEGAPSVQVIGSSERNRRISDFLILDDPDAAAAHALLVFRDVKATAADKRSAFRSAVELNSSNPELWQCWSVLEEREGDIKRSLDLALRAVDSGDNIAALERVGRLIIRLLSLLSEQVPIQNRRLYTGSIIERLERERELLNAESLTILGWLYLISFQKPEASSAASAALVLEPGNGKARDLLRRASS